MAAAYDPVDRHLRYLRERVLKGRQKRSPLIGYQYRAPKGGKGKKGSAVSKAQREEIRAKEKQAKEQIKAETKAQQEALKNVIKAKTDAIKARIAELKASGDTAGAEELRAKITEIAGLLKAIQQKIKENHEAKMLAATNEARAALGQPPKEPKAPATAQTTPAQALSPEYAAMLGG